jgi:iron complex transport system ATP-binding protein
MSRREDSDDHPSLAAIGVDFAYSGTPVLQAVSAAIAPRQLTALVGPNGSGKSTLLLALARFLKPTSGTVELDGQPIGRQHSKSVARRLSILPQNPPLPEKMTVFELVSRGRHPHRGLLGLWSEADLAIVERAMTLTGVSDFANRPLTQLSGGQRQRCWIAMALAQETPIMLLDEPTSALDLRYQLEILDLLKGLCRQHHRTIVVAMHDLNLAAAHADQMIFFREGRVYGSGPTEAICTREIIENVFDIHVDILKNPADERPVFVPSLKTRAEL